jgi:hypothetical protein
MATRIFQKMIVTMSLQRQVKYKTLTLEDENPKGLWAPMWVVDTSTSWGHNFFIRSPFWALDTPLERSNREE